MAAPSGQPQGGAPVKTKKEFTPEQKRTFGLLGVAGVLALIVAGIYLPGMLSGPTATETVQTPTGTTPNPGGITPENGEVPPGVGGGAPGSEMTDGIAAAGAAASPVQASYAPVSRFRSDPFTPFIVNPLPPSDPRVIPPPIQVPKSEEFAPVLIDSPNGTSTANLPSLNLPPVVIPRIATDIKVPRDPMPPARSTGGGGGAGSDPQPSYDKRLSGVVIANGVRALLEVTSGGELKSYVVQPGDTVEGITVLNIQRYSEGTGTITRMLIRENGQERYVDLKAAPQGALGGAGLEGGPGGIGGIGGFPGGRPGARPGGGFPGAP